MSEIIHRRSLREKEASKMAAEFSLKLKSDLNQLLGRKLTRIEIAETTAGKIYFVDKKPLFASSKEGFYPTLFFEQALASLPKIVVNMGAVPHVCNGADLMAPGIVKIEGAFNLNDYVLVLDERHRKPLAVVVALIDSQTAGSLQRGKVAKSLHYVGDSLWNLLKKP